MKDAWTNKNHEIEEGLKPGGKTFRYFFKILENGVKYLSRHHRYYQIRNDTMMSAPKML